MFATTSEPKQDCSNTTGGHIPSNFANFKSISKCHLLTLHTSGRLRQAFSLSPLIAFCHPKNLRDFLVRATLTTKTRESPGIWPCRVARCKTCPISMTMDEFTSHKTGQVFKMKFAAPCKSSNTVYLISCRRYGTRPYIVICGRDRTRTTLQD